MNSLLILGRQPELGLAELVSLYGASTVTAVGMSTAAIVDVDPCLLAFDRLGGSTKFCKVLTTLDTTDWRKIEKFLLEVSPGQAATMPEGKMTLGLSLYGFTESIKRIEATGLSIKKAVRKSGRPVRLVPNKTTEISAPQIIHNNLTSPNGWELVFVKDGNQTIVAQTVKVQDIESYTVRDRERPKRDARVGMLPPKLAQIIINLATGELPKDKLESICEIPAGQAVPRKLFEKTILDPFCGTGVVLQEALLMGYDALGTDLDARMVKYTIENMEWLESKYTELPSSEAEQGDATSHRWSMSPDFVACETYLGRPFTSQPQPEILAQTVSECNLIIKRFLQNIHPQLVVGARLCVAVPAWQTRPDIFRHLPLVDALQGLGYEPVRLSDDPLIYYRANQIVGRELLVLTVV